MAYIPSVRVLKEGGYEGNSSMLVYGMPAERSATDIEEIISTGVDRGVRGSVRKIDVPAWSRVPCASNMAP